MTGGRQIHRGKVFQIQQGGSIGVVGFPRVIFFVQRNALAKARGRKLVCNERFG